MVCRMSVKKSKREKEKKTSKEEGKKAPKCK